MKRYCPIFALLILLVSCNPKQETKYHFKEHDTDGWLIPVRIGEETYSFVFDTGSSKSFIESKLANKLNLKIIDSTLIFKGRDKKISYHNQTEKLVFNIADIPMSTSFHYITDSRNIIGMDIINKYHWMFDRSNKTFQIQEKPISIKTHSSDMVYKKKYRYSSIKVPIVDLLINDTIPIPLLFDSGYSRTHSYKDDTLITTTLPVINLQYYENINDRGFFRYIYNNDAVLHYISPRFFLWLDSITIDDLPPSSFYITTDIDSIYTKVNKEHGYIGTLTWHFIRQFRTFYIDPEKQEFTFIVSPEDSSIIRKSNIEEVAILKKKRKIKFVN